ncbi:hypothetical protein K502DRAFT_363452 [Neoconidiobolus thromboides FSU 785]|nr:hypothetical protein K502DRAFT_363452 [Neoconidiobolus thromboides FSU 785]
MNMNFLYNTFVAPEIEDSQLDSKDQITKLKAQLEQELNKGETANILNQIKNLINNHQKEIGDSCLNNLITKFILEDDNVLLSDYLDIFYHLFDNKENKTNEYCSFFSKEIKAIEKIFSILNKNDFYIKYNGIKVLQQLYNLSEETMNQILIKNPPFINNLMDLIEEDKEMVRNEIIILIEQIIKNNLELQKIFVFQNLYEKIITIIEQEFCFDGGIIVYDCIYLLIQLLKANVSNQLFFIESNYITRLSTILSSLCEQYDPSYWQDRQKVNNILKFIYLINILINNQNNNTNNNSVQTKILKSGIFNSILLIIDIPTLPRILLTHFLSLLAEIINNNSYNQAVFKQTNFLIEDSIPVLLINHILNLALESDADEASKLACINIFKAYLSNNINEKLSFAFKLRMYNNNRSQNNEHDRSIGNLLLDTIIYQNEHEEEDDEEDDEDNDGEKENKQNGTEKNTLTIKNVNAWFSIILLIEIVKNNSVCKDLVLDAKLNTATYGSTNFIQFILNELIGIINKMENNANRSVKDENEFEDPIYYHYLLFLVVIIYDHTSSIQCILGQKENINLFVKLAQLNFNLTIQSLSILVLLLIYQFNDNRNSLIEPEEYKNEIIKQIGIEKIKNIKQMIQFIRPNLSINELLSNYNLDSPFNIVDFNMDLDHHQFLNNNYELALTTFLDDIKLILPKKIETQLEEYEKEIKSQKQQLNDKETVIEALKKHLNELSLKMNEKKEEKEEKYKQNEGLILKLNEELNEKEKLLVIKNKELLNKNSIISNKEAELLVNNNKFSALLREKDNVIASKEKMLQNKDKEIKDKEVELKKLELALQEYTKVSDSVVYL